MAGKNPIKTVGVIGDIDGSLARAFELAKRQGIMPEGMIFKKITDPAKVGLGTGVPLDPNSFGDAEPDFLKKEGGDNR